MKRQNVKRGGGAPVDKVGTLHELATTALLQQLQAEMAEGDVKPATVQAALKLCMDSGVTATQTSEDEIAQLHGMLDDLDLKPVLTYGHAGRNR